MGTWFQAKKIARSTRPICPSYTSHQPAANSANGWMDADKLLTLTKNISLQQLYNILKSKLHHFISLKMSKCFIASYLIWLVSELIGMSTMRFTSRTESCCEWVGTGNQAEPSQPSAICRARSGRSTGKMELLRCRLLAVQLLGWELGLLVQVVLRVTVAQRPGVDAPSRLARPASKPIWK